MRWLLLLAVAAAAGPSGPSAYTPVLGVPLWAAPSAGLPPEVKEQPSNNNVAIARHKGRLYMAWRTGPTHFASPKVVLYVVSSKDGGRTWDFEHAVSMGSDLREPTLISLKGELHLYFVQLGKHMVSFTPQAAWRVTLSAEGRWGEPAPFLSKGEIPWEVKVRDGKVWMTSYKGNHYHVLGKSDLELYFKVSEDGRTFTPADPARPVVYSGGVSEAGFEFDRAGNLWAITRNEDGDASGWGSHLARAPAASPGDWSFPATSAPERYDSPRMFRHEDDIYLLARRDIGGPFDWGWRRLPFALQRGLYLAAYSGRAKRTTLFKLDPDKGTFLPLLDLPSAGDTAFPSILQTGPHSFLIANYTSPLDSPDKSWMGGQLSSRGTAIYLQTLTFKPAPQ